LEAAGRSIWIDLDNTPHVPLFAPIIRHYRDLGIDVILTARDHAKTVELLDLKSFAGTFEVIGRHHGKSKIAKLAGTVARAKQLRAFIQVQLRKGKRISVAVSHGSRAMVFAARSLRIPLLTMYDYEYTETRIFNRFSDKVLVPHAIPDDVLDNIGLSANKRLKYSGLKEEVYIGNYKPDLGLRQSLLDQHNLTGNTVLAVVRPPATTANYHSGESETLLQDVLKHLLFTKDTFVIVVPRTLEQVIDLRYQTERIAPDRDRYTILTDPVDGLDLAYAADLLISGGGTMNREAALLGTPVYSIFTGRLGALDADMERRGVITFIRNSGDVSRIRLERKAERAFETPSDAVESFVIEQINSFL
jgi:predicted glycosyltransferase